MSDLWDELEEREQPTVPVAFPKSPDVYLAAKREVEEARRALDEGRARGVLDIAFREQRLDAAEKTLADQPLLRFAVRALPADAWDDLVGEHPPTTAQRKDGYRWNTSTFRPALLAAAVEPQWSEHQWHVLSARETGLGNGEIEVLYLQACELSNQAVRVDLGKD